MDDHQAQILRFLEIIEPLKSISALQSFQIIVATRVTPIIHGIWPSSLCYVQTLQEDVQIEQVLSMILIHDLGEIIAGDSFAFSAEHSDPSHERQALKALLSSLPTDLSESIAAYWNEFTFGDSNEARYARAIDRLQALAQNVFGARHTRRERGVTEAMSRDLNKEAMSFDPALHSIFEMLYQRAAEEGLWTAKEKQ